MKLTIGYSQSWEDQDVLVQGLEIGPADEILSITSGGDNSLALLLQEPKKIVSVDINPAQSFLLELKIAALKGLPYEDFLQFLGVTKTDTRLKTYGLIKHFLNKEASCWWDDNKSLIASGVIHCGKLERYAALVRKYFLPLTESKSTIAKVINVDSLVEQREIYDKEWKNYRYKLLCKIFLSKPVFSLLGRDKSKFKYSEVGNLVEYYMGKLDIIATQIPAKTNYLLQYGLTGTYPSQGAMPFYMQRKNFEKLQKLIPRLSIVTNDMQDYLKSCGENSFSKFYFSDIFEYLSEDKVNLLFEEIVRVARRKSLIIYWNHLVSRTHPNSLDGVMSVDTQKVESLKKIDKLPIYKQFYVERIKWR